MAAGVGCDRQEEAGGSSVATSAYPLAFVAEQVGGDTVDVSNVVPPGTEPHDVELTPRDVEELEDADLVLYVGDGFQPAVEDAVAGKSNALDALESADPIEGDPHVWLDPLRLASRARSAPDSDARKPRRSSPTGSKRWMPAIATVFATARTG